MNRKSQRQWKSILAFERSGSREVRELKIFSLALSQYVHPSGSVNIVSSMNCFLFFFFFHSISPERSCFGNINFFIYHTLVVLKPMVSLVGRPIACSARIAVDRQTHTHTQTKYCNPRCACMLTVN